MTDPEIFEEIPIKILKVEGNQVNIEILEQKGNFKKGDTYDVKVPLYLRSDDKIKGNQTVTVDLKLIKKNLILSKIHSSRSKSGNRGGQARQSRSNKRHRSKPTVNSFPEGSPPKSIRRTPKANDTEILLPRDTNNTIGSTEPMNFLLSISKYARRVKTGDNWSFKIFNEEVKKGGKVVQSKDINLPMDTSFVHARSYKTRQERLLKKFESIGFDTYVNSRLVIGLGGANVHEISMTLHHIGGFPYVPASSLKGVTRSYIIDIYFGGDEDKALEDDGFTYIFGFSKNERSYAGIVSFYDAYPNEPPLIQPDIMNIHYSSYYQGDKNPTDDQNPTPLTFLTVTEGQFRINLSKNRTDHNEDVKSKIPDQEGKTSWNTSNVLAVVLPHIKEALSIYGIGAKTAIGYGRLVAN